MNDEQYSDRPSGFFFGKEFIIVLVIIFSGISFTLGFFVGKNSAPPKADNLQASSVEVQQPEAQPAASAHAAAPAPQQEQQPVKAGETLVKEIPVVPAAPQDTRQAPKAHEPVQQEKKTISQQQKPAEADAASSAEKETAYAVQVGAFRNPAEARQLKTRFEKKGYRTTISALTDKKGQKVYKVRTGEFREKKEAEVLALKLRKAEGLQTYVVARTE